MHCDLLFPHPAPHSGEGGRPEGLDRSKGIHSQPNRKDAERKRILSAETLEKNIPDKPSEHLAVATPLADRPAPFAFLDNPPAALLALADPSAGRLANPLAGLVLAQIPPLALAELDSRQNEQVEET